MRIHTVLFVAAFGLLQACGDESPSGQNSDGSEGGAGGSVGAGDSGNGAAGNSSGAGGEKAHSNPRRLVHGPTHASFILPDTDRFFVPGGLQSLGARALVEVRVNNDEVIVHEVGGGVLGLSGGAIDSSRIFLAFDAPDAGIQHISRSDYETDWFLKDAYTSALTSDDEDVMWASQFGKVRSIPKAGGKARTLFQGTDEVFAILSDGTQLFWAAIPYKHPDQGSVWRATKGNDSATIFLDGLSSPRALAFDGDELIIACGGTFFEDDDFTSEKGSSNNDGSILAVSKAGGSPRVIADKQPGPFAVALSSTHIYWINVPEERASSNVWGKGKGDVRRIARGGGKVDVLVDGLDQPWSIAVFGRKVYWTEKDEDVIGGSIWVYEEE